MKPVASDASALTDGHIFLTIDSLAFGGEGVGRNNGLVVFVAEGLPGEKLEVRLTETKKGFARGEIVHIFESSPQRQSPPCPYYGRCGGCQYQHLDYPGELAWKEKQVLEQLARVGKIHQPTLHPIIPSPDPYGYRNRISVHAEQGRVGFHQAGTRTIIDVQRCLLASNEVNDQLGVLRGRHPRDGHYSLRAGDVPVSAFFQSNRFLIETLRTLVVSAARGSGGTLVEGYAGGGFFTRELAPQFNRVIAIEEDTRALRDAENLQLPNVEWVAGRVEEYLESVCQHLALPPGLVLVDPPRTGLGRTISETLAHSQARRIIYVSCNPSTLARDAGFLQTSYKLSSIQPIDMFPRTAQIETISVWDLAAA